jgi:hypothetical protein
VWKEFRRRAFHKGRRQPFLAASLSCLFFRFVCSRSVQKAVIILDVQEYPVVLLGINNRFQQRKHHFVVPVVVRVPPLGMVENRLVNHDAAKMQIIVIKKVVDPIEIKFLLGFRYFRPFDLKLPQTRLSKVFLRQHPVFLLEFP